MEEIPFKPMQGEGWHPIWGMRIVYLIEAIERGYLIIWDDRVHKHPNNVETWLEGYRETKGVK